MLAACSECPEIENNILNGLAAIDEADRINIMSQVTPELIESTQNPDALAAVLVHLYKEPGVSKEFLDSLSLEFLGIFNGFDNMTEALDFVQSAPKELRRYLKGPNLHVESNMYITTLYYAYRVLVPCLQNERSAPMMHLALAKCEGNLSREKEFLERIGAIDADNLVATMELMTPEMLYAIQNEKVLAVFLRPLAEVSGEDRPDLVGSIPLAIITEINIAGSMDGLMEFMHGIPTLDARIAFLKTLDPSVFKRCRGKFPTIRRLNDLKGDA